MEILHKSSIHPGIDCKMAAEFKRTLMVSSNSAAIDLHETHFFLNIS